MKKWIGLLLFFGPLTPAHAFTVTSPNAYMVENTTGTNGCYDFQTTPTCSASIVGLSISTSTIGNLVVSTITGNGVSPRLLIVPQSDSRQAVEFWNAGKATEIMTIDTQNLRVGIRNPTPNKTLDVGGDVNIGGNLNSGDIIFNDASIQTTAAFQSILVAGTTSYPQFLYVGSSATISGIVKASTFTATVGFSGSTTGTASPAGDFGEYVSSTTTANTNTTGTTQYTNIAQISLSAGNWCVAGTVTGGAGTATPTRFMGAVSINSGNTVTDLVV